MRRTSAEDYERTARKREGARVRKSRTLHAAAGRAKHEGNNVIKSITEEALTPS